MEDNKDHEEVHPVNSRTIETEVLGSNPVLTLITTEDGIPTSTEVTVLTTALGDVPLMTATLESLSEVPLVTTHPAFVTSHSGVNTVYDASIEPSHGGQTVVVSEGTIVMGSDAVGQTFVVHTADPSQLTLERIQPDVGSSSNVVSLDKISLTGGMKNITVVGLNEVEQVSDSNTMQLLDEHTYTSTRQQAVLQMINDVPTQVQVISQNTLLAEQLLKESASSGKDNQLHTTEEVELETLNGHTASDKKETNSDSAVLNDVDPTPEILPSNNTDLHIEIVSQSPLPMEITDPQLAAVSVPEELICLVCYQAFLNPKKKFNREVVEDTATLATVKIEVDGASNGNTERAVAELIPDERSLDNIFELSRVSISIVTRRLFNDCKLPICSNCNGKFVKLECIIRELKVLEKELYSIRQKIKDEIISSHNFFKVEENKELAEKRKETATKEVLEIIDKIREDIINGGRPPKIPRKNTGINGGSRRRKSQKLLQSTEEKVTMSQDPSSSVVAVGPSTDMEDKGTSSKDADTVNVDNDPRISEDPVPTDPLQDGVSVKSEIADKDKDAQPAIRTSFGRIVRRPAYMISEATDDELSDLGESSEDNHEDIEVKPGLIVEGEDDNIVEDSELAELKMKDEENNEDDEDPAWSPGRGVISISEKIGIPATSSEESEELTDYDSDEDGAHKAKVKLKKERKDKKSRRQKKQKTKRKTTKSENVNYEVKVIQLDGTELMTINTTDPDDNIGLEPEITQKVMNSQAVIMVKNQLFGKRVQCPHCPRSFTDPVRRDVHVKKKHEGDNKPHGCVVCSKRFTRHDHLINHMKRHSKPQKDKPKVYKQTVSKKTHTCQFCDQRFRNKSELSVHTRMHTGERPFKCDYCEEGFVSTLKKEFHIEQAHPEVPPIRCEFCPRGFFRQHRLRIHAVSHTGEKSNICEICGKSFSQAAMLRYHQTTHEELNLKQFKCQQCNRVFANPQNLKSHMESQHQKMYRHRCDTCGRGYTQMSHLRRHLRTHSGEQPFVCSYCPKKFTSGAALKIHCRIHTGERPYWCAQCEKGFRSKTKLGRHLKTLIHSGEANKLKKEQTETVLTEVETLDIVTDVNAAPTATWTEIVGIITGV